MFMVVEIYISKYSNPPLVELASEELMGMKDQMEFSYTSLVELAHQQMTLLLTWMI